MLPWGPMPSIAPKSSFKGKAWHSELRMTLLSWRNQAIALIETCLVRVNEVESRTGAVTLVSRWRLGWAFALPAQSGLAWLCFLFPLIEPDRRSYRIRLSEKTHDVTCDAACNF